VCSSNHRPTRILREALELILARDNLAASFVLSRGGSMPLDDAVDALIEIEKIVANVIREGQRRIAEKAIEVEASPYVQTANACRLDGGGLPRAVQHSA
jgi:hypothetical protein